MKNIILASSSPRRKELLKKIVSDFIIEKPEFDEAKISLSEPCLFAMVAAYQKAYSILKKNPDKIVIGCDTLVTLEGRILGKPNNLEDAKKMLESLSNKNHRVISGVAILSNESKTVNYIESNVLFKKLTEDIIFKYLATEEYKDKAGAYAIQGYGRNLVDSYFGDIDNIIGLPTSYLSKALKELQ